MLLVQKITTATLFIFVLTDLCIPSTKYTYILIYYIEYRHSKWDASISFPSAYEATHDLFSHDSDKVDLLMQHAEVDSRGTFLFHKVCYKL